MCDTVAGTGAALWLREVSAYRHVARSDRDQQGEQRDQEDSQTR